MSGADRESPIDAALRSFEATEANLEKLERLLRELHDLIPDGIQFGRDPAYDDRCRAYADLLAALPTIDGWKPQTLPLRLNDIAQWRLDAFEVGEISMSVALDEAIEAPAQEVSRYRYLFNRKRRQVVRSAVTDTTAAADTALRALKALYPEKSSSSEPVESEHWDDFKQRIEELETLLGSSFARPAKWSDLRRHVRFGHLSDLSDIIRRDWPQVKVGLSTALHDQNEPVPVDVDDLETLAAAQPTGTVATKLNWSALTAEDFERLLFELISSASGYENAELLMQTNAPDRGRDLSVDRVVNDPLAGVTRRRVIIQCKHWPNRSIAVADVEALRGQMKLWEPPRVDVLVIATAGRFASDTVALIERNNIDDRALRIEMWPEPHLHRLLAARPGLIAEFHLR